jgi:hypothetical protein
MSVIITEITREELQVLIEQAVWKALSRLVQDPDYGLTLRDEVVERLEASESISEDELISVKDVVADLNLKW